MVSFTGASTNAGTTVTLTGCSADSARLGGTPSASGGTTPYTYNWSPNAGLTCNNCPNPYVSHLGASGTYQLIVTDSNGCSATSDVNVNVTGTTLTVNAGNSVSFCQGATIHVTLGGTPTAVGGVLPYTYVWSPSSSLSNASAPNPVASPTSTTHYSVVVTDANGCIGSDTVDVIIHPAPVAQAGAADTICAGSTIILGGSPTASGGTGSTYTYNWSPGIYINSTSVANPVANPTSDVTYVVTVTDSLGCTATSSVSVIVHQNPTANAGNNQTVVSCPSACVTLGGTPTATGGSAPYRYAWSPGGGLNNTGLSNPTACNLGAPVTYEVTVTDANGCTGTAITNINVTQSTLSVSAGGNKNICAGQTNGVVIGGSPTVSGGSTPYTIIWSPSLGLNANNVTNPTANPADTTQYNLFVQDALGCIATDSMTVFVNPAVVVSVTSDTSVCNGGSTTLGGSPTASGGNAPYTYIWSPGIGLQNISSANPLAHPTTTSTYCLTVTDVAGCSASACETVTVNPAITVCAGPGAGYSMTNCAGSSVTLGCTPTATGGSGNFSYSWSPDSVGGVQVLNSNTVANPIVTGLAQSTIFTVTVTDNITGCFVTAQVKVSVTPSSLTANAGGGKIFCANSNGCVQLGGNPTATGGVAPYDYAWSPGTHINSTTIANPCVSPLNTTTYYLTVTDQLGCSQIDSSVVTVSPFIAVNAGTDTTICYGQSVTLGGTPEVVGGTGSFTYNWTPSQYLSSTVVAHPTAQTLTSNISYTLAVTDSFGCSASGLIQIAVRPLPVANAGPNATIYACALDSAVIGGNPTASGTVGPYTYQWSPPFDSALNCETCPNPVVRNLGHQTQFCVTVTDTFGCQATSCATVTVLPNTVFVNAGGATVDICANASNHCVTLGGHPTVSGGVAPYTYQWFGGVSDSLIANPQACPATTTKYIIIGTDVHGCQAADSTDVVVNPAPVVSIAGLDTAYCVNSASAIMTGTPAGGTFSGPGVVGNVFEPSQVGVGLWCVQYSYTNAVTGCSADTTICVHVNSQPTVSISGYTTTNFCQNDAPITLVGSPAGGTFSGNGITGNVFNPANAIVGTNYITYTYTNGCTNTATVAFNVKGAPTLSIAVSSDTICQGQSVTITPTYSFDVFNVIYNKEGGGVIASGVNPVTFVPTGVNYCVVATAVNTPNGCAVHDTLCMHITQKPVVTIDTAHTCELQTVTINVGAEVTDPNGNADNITVLTNPAHGGLQNNGGGIYTYNPTGYFFGLDSFKFVACNDLCTTTCDTATQFVSVCFIHYPPVITDTTITTYTGDTVDVCPYIYDVNGLSLTIGNANCAPLNGTLTFTSDSCFQFIPTLSYTGTQTLCITVCDSLGSCDTGTVIIHVLPRNVPPIAYRINVTECNQAPIGVNVASATVDPDGHVMTYGYGGITGPGAATWHITSEGAGVFTASVPGTYTMPYYVCNHSTAPINSLCDSNLIVVTVVACDSVPNDSIKANNDGAVTHVGVPVIINELANDYYPNADSLTVTIVSGPDLGGSTASIDSNGSIDYNSPTPGIDTIVYQICDPSPLCATASIVVFVDTTPVYNYPPVAVNDYDSTNYLTNVTVPVLNNDYSNNGDSIIMTGVVTPPAHGTTVVNSNGTITYIPNGTDTLTDTFTYVDCDANALNLCDTATVVINVRPFNVPPIALKQVLSTCVNEAVGVDVSASTTDPHGNPLTYTYTPTAGITTVVTGTGSLVVVSGTPGTYSIPYTVCNHSPQPLPSLCSSNVIEVEVVNCPVISNNDSIHANPDATVTTVNVPTVINELGNDFYPNPDSLTVTIVSGPNLPGATDTINSDGTIGYKSPTPGIDTIVYQICDPAPLCSTASIVVYVDTLPLVVTNYPPVAVNDFDSTNYGQPVIVPVLSNDWSPNGDSIVQSGVTTPPANGTVTVNPNGTITYTPGTNVGGSDTFDYRICDYNIPTLCDTAQVVVYIRNFNVPPIALKQVLSTCVNEAVGIDLAASTTDPHGNPLTYTYTPPAGITVVTTGNGALVAVSTTPGTYTIPYTVCNHSPQAIHSLCASNVIVVEVVNCPVIPNNDSIHANPDGVVTQEGVPTVINELGNDFYPNPDSLTVTIVSGPYLPGATDTINPNGTITYKSPTPGNDSIVYQICDPAPLCSTATIYIYVDSLPIVVTDTNYRPVAVNDFDSTNYGQPVIVPVLGNDWSPNGDSIVQSGIVTPPANGTATVNPNGTITYTPGANVGTSDTFDYRICDYGAPTLCDTAQVVVYIRNYNVPPIAMPVTASVCYSTTIGINVAAGTTDPHSNPLTYTYGSISGLPGATLVVTGNGAVDFTAAAPGTYIIPYTVCNHSPQPLYSLCASSDIIVRVIDCRQFPNDSIHASNDAAVTTVNVPIQVNELANDYYPYPDSLTVTVISGPHLPGATDTINPNGTIAYNSPTPGIDSIVYQICDPAPLCATATIYIYVDTFPPPPNGPNYPPVAVDDFDSTNYNTPIVVPVLSNDWSPNGDSIIITNITSGPDSGTAVINPNGTVTYTPNGLPPGYTDTFDYRICDYNAPTLCDTAQVVIYIRDYNVPPIALPQTASTCVTQAVGIDVAGSTTDPHGNPMTYFYGSVTPAGGHYVITGNGSLYFWSNTPGTYTIPYTVCNHSSLAINSLCSSSTITVEVINCNTTPNDSIHANPDGMVTTVNTPTNINELGNDFYPNPDSLTVTVVVGPHLPGSSYVINPNGTITYTSPVPGYDSIEYQICDPAPLCSTATIYIYVDTTPNVVYNYPPVAVNDYDSTNYNTPVIVPVLSNDYSNNGDSIVLTNITSGPDSGSAVINSNGTVTYTPYGLPGTTDTFEYKICDYNAPTLCDTAQVVIYIRPLKEAPLAFKQNVTTCETQAIGIDVAASTVDPLGLTLHFAYGTVTGPGTSTLAVTGNGAIVFAAATPGVYTIPYTVCNADPLCASSVITVTVVNCNLVPNDSIKANDDGVVTNTNTATLINELANDYYPGPDSLTVTVLVGPHLPGSSYVINANGTITYTSPVPGDDSIVYQICDPAPLCSTATIYIVVDTVPLVVPNGPPVAVNDFDSTTVGTPVIVPVLSNDYSPEGDSIVITNIPCSPDEGGTAVITGRTITYTPGPNTLSTDTFCYKICDANDLNLCDTAQVVIYIKPFPFSLKNDTEYICGKDTINKSVLANATVQHGIVLHVSGVGPVSPANLGTVTYNDSVVTFHAEGITGTATFTYYVCDNGTPQLCDTASFITYIGSCPPPVSPPLIDTTPENTPDTVCLHGLVVSTTPWQISNFCNPMNGTVSTNPGDTCFTYIPAHNFVGNDTFCVVVCNANGCDTSTVIITVLDSTIKAVPESCDVDTMDANSTLKLDVLANDIIPAAKDTVVTVSVAPVNGVAVVNTDNTIQYTPNHGYEGTEQFTYQVCAETGRFKFCDTADICVTITGPCFIPNAFSPNGDNMNDTYVIPCNEKYPNASIQIFDRWGMEVWRSNGHYLNDFDGHNQQGVKLPDGTYYFVYQYNDGTGRSEAKFVVITR